MTTPPAPGPDPAGGPQPPPQPPAPVPPAPQPGPPPSPPAPAPAPPGPPGNGAPTQADLDNVRRALEHEKAARKAAEAKLAKATAGQMSDEERRLAEARAEGAKEARQAAGRDLAAEAFRAACAGRQVDGAKLAEALDWSRYVDEDGKVDRAAVTALVDSLPAPAPGHIPGGPQGQAAGSEDFLGLGMRQGMAPR